MGADTFDRKSTIPSHKLSLPLNPVSQTNKIGYFISTGEVTCLKFCW